MTLLLALFIFAACNRDAVERNAPHDITTTEASTTPTDTSASTAASSDTGSTALVPVGTNANTVTTETPAQGGAQTTTRAITEQPPADAAPAPTQQIAAGQPLFKQHCATCHGADGRKTVGRVTLASKETQSRSESELAQAFQNNPAHKQLGLQQAQLSPVIAYVKALQ
ncbi:MAG: cytochrome c [Acidobacteriota bacterium]|nr:cytochrome c [Acidobacteriota bacterium]